MAVNESRAYYWVSDELRAECRKIIDKADLIVDWDAWHKCMRREGILNARWGTERFPLWAGLRDIADMMTLFFREVNFIIDLVFRSWIKKVSITTEELPAEKMLFVSYEDCVLNKDSAIYYTDGCKFYRKRRKKQIEAAEKFEREKERAREKLKPKPKKVYRPPRKPKVIIKRIRRRGKVVREPRRLRGLIIPTIFGAGIRMKKIGQFQMQIKNLEEDTLALINANNMQKKWF